MGDGTADWVRVDSLAEWQAAAEEVRRLERVAQGRREVLLSAARADALAQGELGAGRRLLAGLERSLIAGTALAGPSLRAPLTGTQALKPGRFATGAEIRGEARKVPVEDWQADELKPRGPVVGITTDIFTVTPASDAPLQPGDRVTIEQAQAHLDKAISNMGKLVNDDAPSTDYYTMSAHEWKGVEMANGIEVKPITSREAKIARKAREASDPADYWSGAARNPRRWWQVWRKK